MLPAIFLHVAAVILAVQLPGTAAVEPAQTSDARVELSLDKPAYRLGEPVLLHYCVVNASTQPFDVTMGGDNRAASRAQRFKVTVTNSEGRAAPDPDPGGFHLGGLSFIAPPLPPGGRRCDSLLLMRYARIDAPGTYSIRVTHDLGWKSTRPPEGLASVAFSMPTAEEADRIVAATLALPNEQVTSADGLNRTLTPRRDFSVFRYPIYLTPLVRIAESGNIEALVGIGSIPTPDATRALIALLKHPNRTLARDASRQLAARMPDPALEGRLPRRGAFSNDMEDPRRYLRDAAWRPELAGEIRLVIAEWLAADDPALVIQAAFMVEAIGTAADAPALSGALDRALERTLTLPFEKGGYPRPRGAMQELMRAADVLLTAGYVPPAAPATPGDAALWLTAFGKGSRPENWQATMRTMLEHRIPYVRELALNWLPDTAPPELLAAVGPALQHSDVDLQIAAVNAVTRLKLVARAPQVTGMCRSATDFMVFNSACNALHATSGRVAVLEIMTVRLAEPAMFTNALSRLFGALEIAGHGGSSDLSADVKADLSQRWTSFIQTHRTEIDAGKRFSIDDPAVAGLIPPGWKVTPIRK